MLAIKALIIIALFGFVVGAWHGWEKERDVVMAMLIAMVSSIAFFFIAGFFIGSFYILSR